MPATRLQTVNLGKEVTWGTPVAATARLMGATNAKFNNAPNLVVPDLAGSLGPGTAGALTRDSAVGGWDQQYSYEDLPFILDSLLSLATPSGAGPYVRAYATPTTALPTPRYNTIEFGQAGAPYKVDGAIITEVEIGADQGDDGMWKGPVSALGKKITTVTLASLSNRAVTWINLANTALYIDADGGTMGATLVADTMYRFTLKITTGRHLKHFNNSIYPTDKGEAQFMVTLDMAVEFNATAKAVYDALIGGTAQARQVRLKATSGTNIAQLDFPGYLTAMPFDDRDGNLTAIMSLRAFEDIDGIANYFKASVTNSVATMP